MQRSTESGWVMLGDSVKGASHGISGLPNQDAIEMQAGEGGLLPLVLCISDGHGSAKCFRSNIGSHAATFVGTRATHQLIADLTTASLSELKRAAQSQLPREIVKCWRALVADHILKNPFTEEELQILGRTSSPQSRQELDGHKEFFLAYGATLIVVAVLERCAIYLQLGDGDVLVLSASGRLEAPVPIDAELIANETTSLCMPKATSQFRAHFQVFENDPPALIIAATDGYANSFASTSDFHQSGPDLLRLLRRDGAAAVETALPNWLNGYSSEGSGDDVTLGLIWQQVPSPTLTNCEVPHE